jgi:hypothetical protein
VRYAQIANYSPNAGVLADGTYVYSGMGAVTTPEGLVAGEAFAYPVSQMSGNGESGVDSFFKYLGVFALGMAAGYYGSRYVMKKKLERALAVF